jgi:putative ABC transport system ATP-binding protein
MAVGSSATVEHPQVPLLVRDLVFGWSRDQVLLSIPELRLAAGERVFLHGPSGSGKSTLLNLVAGTLAPRSGSIRLGDVEATALPPRCRDRLRAERMGLVFQQFNLLPFLSVRDNVLLGCRFSKRRRARAIAHDGSLEAAAHRLLAALGLADGPIFNRPAAELSVGQQQRVAAARALIGEPDLVIADEPTSALDADARHGFLRLVGEECARSGAALLFVSHDRALEADFDRTLDLRTLNHAAPGAPA